MVKVTGDKRDEKDMPVVEEHELWARDVVECIRELIGNTAFDGHMCYVPEEVYADMRKESQIFDEMWTGSWWKATQVGPARNFGSYHNGLIFFVC